MEWGCGGMAKKQFIIFLNPLKSDEHYKPGIA